MKFMFSTCFILVIFASAAQGKMSIPRELLNEDAEKAVGYGSYVGETDAEKAVGPDSWGEGEAGPNDIGSIRETKDAEKAVGPDSWGEGEAGPNDIGSIRETKDAEQAVGYGSYVGETDAEAVGQLNKYYFSSLEYKFPCDVSYYQCSKTCCDIDHKCRCTDTCDEPGEMGCVYNPICSIAGYTMCHDRCCDVDDTCECDMTCDEPGDRGCSYDPEDPSTWDAEKAVGHGSYVGETEEQRLGEEERGGAKVATAATLEKALSYNLVMYSFAALGVFSLIHWVWMALCGNKGRLYDEIGALEL